MCDLAFQYVEDCANRIPLCVDCLVSERVTTLAPVPVVLRIILEMRIVVDSSIKVILPACGYTLQL